VKSYHAKFIAVLVLVFCAVLFFEKGPFSETTYSFRGALVPAGKPVSASVLAGPASPVRVVFPKRGFNEKILLVFSITADADLTAKRSRFTGVPRDPVIRQNLKVSKHPRVCRPWGGAGGFQCRIVLEKGNREAEVALASAGDPARFEVAAFAATYVKVGRAGVPLGNRIWALLLLVVAVIPVVWFLHPVRAVSQWFLIGVAAACLGLVQPVFALLLFVFLGLMYLLGNAVRRIEARTLGFLASMALFSIGFLALWKYGQHFLFAVFADMGDFGLALPLGISYFIIRLLDTQLKWYRGELEGVSFREYMVFIVFPPTIPAGPIETLTSFHDNRLERITKDDVAHGLARMSLGFAKKVVLSDIILVGLLFENETAYFQRVVVDPAGASGTEALVFLVGHFLYAYLDFSAYSDMAIGLSRIFGYRVRENFNWPILAANLQDYWRRWHMSLSNWCMRNIYLPSLMASKNPYLPLYTTMMAVGLWHSFNLSWFGWAIHHGTGLVVVTFLAAKAGRNIPWAWTHLGRPVRILMTVLFVSAGHSFVSISDHSTAIALYIKFWKTILLMG
jgi:alginate O-acetyltransferase complex protein AlgI